LIADAVGDGVLKTVAVDAATVEVFVVDAFMSVKGPSIVLLMNCSVMASSDTVLRYDPVGKDTVVSSMLLPTLETNISSNGSGQREE
jgi:hypothetical protein